MAAHLSVAELVDLGDLDELLRRIDDLCDAGEWRAVLDLRDRCRTALERGRQLWPAASHAEYRLALQAPGKWAAIVAVPGSGPFALGPLSEVAASSHTWDELVRHLPPTPVAALVAQERVLRGEDLSGDERVDRAVTELPLRLEPWEPSYPLATYKPYSADFDDPPPPPGPWTPVTPATRRVRLVEDPDAVAALVELVQPWTGQSNGTVAAVAVGGDAGTAVATLGGTHMTELAAADALATLAWAAASGGAHGRRRGMAQGRFAAWWTAAALAGALDDWPDIAAAIRPLRWYRWDGDEPTTGWFLRLAAELPGEGRAWAVRAADHR